ncbi:MAG: hypothetical protein M1816_003667 [Peltula sp. TS41687]|nr:MAG: hypothetical protein M1816_003667 [Peltula sp. TS41687]
MGVTPIHAPRRFSVSGPAQPDFAADHMEVDVEALITTERSADIYFEHPIYHRLSKYSPFKPMPAGLNNLQLRLRYELTRISLHTGVELSDLSSLSSELSSDYTTFWNQIQQHESLRGKQLPAKSSARAWNAALNDFHEILLSGTLEPITQSEGPMLKLKLSPLQPQQPHRLGRKFGFDRYLKLTVPVLNKDDSEGISRVIFSWLAREEHHMFGRKWSSFYLRNRRKDKKKAFIKEDRNKAPRKEVFLFATDGCDFAGAKKSPFKSQPLRALKPMTAETMLEWLIPFHAKPNQEGRCLKIFSRISLGLTPTEPAIVFDPSQIEWRETDIMSTEDPEQEMNDGCDVISLSAAKAIAKALNIEGSIPSAFQARIAGAKGLWIVDPCENPYLSDPNDFSSPRISISPSQVKFKNHPEDERSECYDQARLTFEVVKYSKPLRSADINLDLIPILTAQGVPKSAFEKLLSDHLSHLVRELQAAVSDGCVFRKWIHDHYFPASHDRESDASRGDLPARKLDQIIMLLEGGFNIQNCWVLKELAFKVLSIHCKRFEDKISIPVGRSTRVYCVPDVTRTLEEGTVHLGFSGKFFDQESGFDDTKLKDIDVLVARSPAVRPYDIQKVRAVVNPELSHLKDVIVFSTQGAIPLAAKLAGGDYDGDTVWVCWDPILVKPFQNADKPDDPKPQDLGIIQDETKIQELPQQNVVTEMVRRSFVFGATGPKLGFCTLYYRRLCYTEGSMTCKGARWIAALLGYLVDQEKQGYIFTDAMWNELKKRPDLVSAKPVDKTAYEDDSATKPTKHILDQLKFFVTKPMIKTALEQFNQPIKEPALYDRDISKLWKHVKARAERDPQIQNLVVSLEKQIRELHTSWSQRMCLRDETDECKTFKSVLDDCFSRYEAISPPEGDHPLISWWANDEEAIWPQDGTSMWNLLKASAVYFFYHMAKFPWYMAGTKLAVLKLKATNRMKPMDEGIHASYKPSASYFRNKREKLAAPVEELVDSEEDEFGDIDDYFDLEGDF